MKNSKLWNELISKLKTNIIFLPDKPEETVKSTLQALWLTASGNPKSAEAALLVKTPELNNTEEINLLNLIEKRISGVPLAHLTERQQFMGVELLAGPEALVPRKETELLGNAALNLLNNMGSMEKPLILMDVCTGAGNLAVSLTVLHPNIKTFAADLSENAVTLAKNNVHFLQLEDKIIIEAGDLLEPFNSKEFHNQVDLLLCNPPYISSAKVETMTEEISKFEPRLAFDGGAFGIKILKKLIQQAPIFLKSSGWLAFEVGLGQGPAIVKLLEKNKNYSVIKEIKDAAENIRALCVKRV